MLGINHENLFLLISSSFTIPCWFFVPILPPSREFSLGRRCFGLKFAERPRVLACPLCPCRAADAVLKGQVETIVSFHIQNTSSSEADRSTAPPVRCVGNGTVG